jgi:hypothetical protein
MREMGQKKGRESVRVILRNAEERFAWFGAFDIERQSRRPRMRDRLRDHLAGERLKRRVRRYSAARGQGRPLPFAVQSP